MRVLLIITVLILFTLPLTSTVSLYGAGGTPNTDIVNSQYSTHLPILVADNSDFTLLGFPGSGIASDPYLIEGVNITRDYYCITISGTSAHFTIRNCYLNSPTGWTAINFVNIEYGLIENCIIEGGIYLSSCEWTRLENNIIVGSDEDGIHAQSGGFLSIAENSIFANERGIRLNGANNCSINNNRVYSNTRRGIEIDHYANFNNIFENSIGWNEGLFSLTGERNAEDNGENNTWFDNRWSDHVSGLYNIPGDANSIDGRALRLNDFDDPAITGPVIDTVVQGNETALLNWTIVEEFPFSYELYQNGELVDGGYLTWDCVTIPLGSRPSGEYNFTIWVSDGSGNSDTLQQIVQVVPAFSTNSILLAGVGIGAIIAVLIMWEKILRPRRKMN